VTVRNSCWPSPRLGGNETIWVNTPGGRDHGNLGRVGRRLTVMRRLSALVSAAVLAVVFGAAAGCSGAADHTAGSSVPRASAGLGSAGPAPGRVRWPGFRREGLAFRHPSAWRPQFGLLVGTLATRITVLSTARLRNPCQTYPHGVTCRGRILEVLPPGGVLVSWVLEARFGTGRPVNGPRTTIGGHRAFVSTRSWTGCPVPGAQQVITAAIRQSRGNWLVMTACLRSPGLPQNEAAVWAMLRSVRLS
jgi:hypothetical protein